MFIRIAVYEDLMAGQPVMVQFETYCFIDYHLTKFYILSITYPGQNVNRSGFPTHFHLVDPGHPDYIR
jgi:hypothetical protein